MEAVLSAHENRRVAELFAGVGGFRLGLEGAPDPGLRKKWPGSGWNVVWSNQWEPGTKAQHASDIYVKRFGPDGHVNEDIAKVLDEAEAGRLDIPDFDLLVGGFPCQDYSVAKTLNQSAGIEGKKGVLWWEIHRLLQMKRPRYVLLENVDRLLKSPATRRGRDFAIILACLSDLGYAVEWRVVNAADYGFPQRRRRVFIAAHRLDGAPGPVDGMDIIFRSGVMARGLPVRRPTQDQLLSLALSIDGELYEITDEFGSAKPTPFAKAGFMLDRKVWTTNVEPKYLGKRKTLCDVLIPDADVSEEFFIPEAQLEQWRYLKGAKSEPRKSKTGHTYFYTEGAVAFPEPLEQPSRTILTGEGGSTPSRFKHVVQTEDGRYRRLTPIELERLNGFPDNWTEGIPDGRRAFMMGNALVVSIVQRLGSSFSLPETPRVLAEAQGA